MVNTIRCVVDLTRITFSCVYTISLSNRNRIIFTILIFPVRNLPHFLKGENGKYNLIWVDKNHICVCTKLKENGKYNLIQVDLPESHFRVCTKLKENGKYTPIWADKNRICVQNFSQQPSELCQKEPHFPTHWGISTAIWCLRDWRLSASWGSNRGPPSPNITAIYCTERLKVQYKGGPSFGPPFWLLWRVVSLQDSL